MTRKRRQESLRPLMVFLIESHPYGQRQDPVNPTPIFPARLLRKTTIPDDMTRKAFDGG